MGIADAIAAMGEALSRVGGQAADVLTQIMMVFDLVAQERTVVQTDGTITSKLFSWPSGASP